MTSPVVRRLVSLNAGLLVATLVVLLVVPALVGPALIGVIATANCYVIFAASWDILSGYTGQVNFGHAAFIGAGGFTVGLLSKYQDGVPAELQLLSATAVAALLGVVIGVPCLRLTGPYLALATLSAAAALFQLSFVYKKQTGGEEGIAGIPRLRDSDLMGPLGKGLAKVFTFGAYGSARRLEQIAYVNYYVTLVVMALVMAGLLRLGYGRRGLVLRSIQQDETAAEAAGVPVVRYKLGAFVLSGALAGLGGGLLVQTRGSAGIDLLLVSLSLLVIIIAAIGGAGSIIGPAVGAYLVILLQNYYLDKVGLFEDHPELKPGLFALVLIVVLIVQPRGIVPPLLGRLRRPAEEAS
ncbi:MAG TPA: branched-chain amino acid ABC transporter permease [Mycobacteriales bacterium]|nr:branched-chain amino acid ABC transporter permease [Mycobacteriales bacterium]